MNKKIALSAFAFALIIPTSLVFASNDESPEIKTTEAQESQREANKKAFEATREANKKNNEVQKEERKRAFETAREQDKQEFEKQREIKKQEFEAQREAIKLEFEDRKEKIAEDKCKNIEERIANRLNHHENNSQMMNTVYGNMQQRIARLIERLKTAGADTTQLEADFSILITKIEKLRADHATFIATLTESQSFVCGKSEGEFKGKMEEARKVPEIIKQDREEIKSFFEKTIKADLKAIRAKLATQKEAATPPTTVTPDLVQ